MANGPVDAGTMRRMTSKKAMYTSLGGIFSRHHKGPQAAAIQAGYNRMGEEAAENMRQRFYKNEWDQVRETRIKPELDKLKRAQTKWKMMSTPASTDYVETLSHEEAEQLKDTSRSETTVEAMNQQEQGGQQTNPGEGPANVVNQGQTSAQNRQKTSVTQQGGNPAAGVAGQLGVQSHRQEMTIPDPRTGQRVLLNSEQGIALVQEASNDFWAANAEIQQELMTIGSEYGLNPYANNFMKTIMQNASNAMGRGVTGKSDPTQIHQKWTEMQQKDADLESRRIQIEDARRAQQVTAAQTQSMAGVFDRKHPVGSQPGGLFGNQYPDDMTNIEKQVEMASLEAEDAAARKLAREEKTVRLPDQVVDNPGQQLGWMLENDDQLNSRIEFKLSEQIAEQVTQAVTNPSSFVTNNPILREPKYARIKMLVEGNMGDSSEVKTFIKQELQKTSAGQKATVDSFLERSLQLSTLDPRRNEASVRRFANMVADLPETTQNIKDLARLDPHYLLALHNGIQQYGERIVPSWDLHSQEYKDFAGKQPEPKRKPRRRGVSAKLRPKRTLRPTTVPASQAPQLVSQAPATPSAAVAAATAAPTQLSTAEVVAAQRSEMGTYVGGKNVGDVLKTAGENLAEAWEGFKIGQDEARASAAAAYLLRKKALKNTTIGAN